MITITYPFKREILACGTRDWSAICLAKKSCAYLINEFDKSPEETLSQYYEKAVSRLKKELKLRPQVIVHDLYPDCDSTKYAQGLSQKDKKLSCLAVQHHHAHIASCLAENEVAEDIIALVMDNSGLGEDGNHWGGECFLGNLTDGFTRVAQLQYVPVVGNERSFRQPWQLAAAFLYSAFGDDFDQLPIDFIRSRQNGDWQRIKEDLCQDRFSSSASGLFDAVAALVGLREKLDYEGQGAMDLERIANRSSHVANRTYDFSVKKEKELLVVVLEGMFQNIVQDLKNNISRSVIAAAFYNTVTEIAKDICEKISKREKVKKVALTGSLFQNKAFTAALQGLLEASGLEVVKHRQFTYNDNSVAFGQAVIADTRIGSQKDVKKL